MINLSMAEPDNMLRPRISVVGVGGAGGNAINNMIRSSLEGCDFIAANTDAQALAMSLASRKLQLGVSLSRGLGAGSKPIVGQAAAEEQIAEILSLLEGSDMLFVTAGMGGGTGTGAAPVIARIARESGILTVGVVTKPFNFEGAQRMRQAEAGIAELQKYVDTLIVIPNQNLFRIANERTTIAEAFRMADEVLHSGVRGITDLMVMPGFMNLDFADVKTVMGEMGKAMMGTGESDGDNRAIRAAEAAISNPLLDDISMKGARGVLINVTGGHDMTLFEMDQAANRIREEVDADAQIKVGSTLDETITGRIRVSVIATGIDAALAEQEKNRASSGSSNGSSNGSSTARTPYTSSTGATTQYARPAAEASAAASAPVATAASSMPPQASVTPPRAGMPDVAPKASLPVPPRNVTVGSNSITSSNVNLSTSYFTMPTPMASQIVARQRMNEGLTEAKSEESYQKPQQPDLLSERASSQSQYREEPIRDQVSAAHAAMETMATLRDDEETHEVEMQEAVNAPTPIQHNAYSDPSPRASYSAAPSQTARDYSPGMSRSNPASGSPVMRQAAPQSQTTAAPQKDMRITQLTPQNAASAAQASPHVNQRSQSLFQRITGFGMVRPSAAHDDDDFDDAPVAQTKSTREAGEKEQADLLEIPAFLRRQTNH